MCLSLLPLAALYIKKKYPSVLQPCKMLNTSGIKPLKNFAHLFFIDIWDWALRHFAFIGFLEHNFLCFSIEKHPPHCEIVKGVVIVFLKSFITSQKASFLYFVLKKKEKWNRFHSLMRSAWRLVFRVLMVL